MELPNFGVVISEMVRAQVEHKTTTKTNNEGALTSKKADLEGTQHELDAALAYYDKLKPSCVDAGVSIVIYFSQGEGWGWGETKLWKVSPFSTVSKPLQKFIEFPQHHQQKYPPPYLPTTRKKKYQE